MANPSALNIDRIPEAVIKLEVVKGDRVEQGTGFIYEFGMDEHTVILAIITNRHVLEGGSKVYWRLSGLAGSAPTVVEDEAPKWVFHPDDTVDLAAYPIAEPDFQRLAHMPSGPVAALGEGLLPDQGVRDSLRPLEKIVSFGYPRLEGIGDDVQPIARRGSTATSPTRDYGGEQIFLVDMPVIKGSSGSPVLLADEGMYVTRGGRTVVGHRLMLLGVLSSTPWYVAEGVVSVTKRNDEPMKTETQAFPNLGVVVHARCIEELKPRVRNLASEIKAAS